MKMLHTVIYPLILKQMSLTFKERTMVKQNIKEELRRIVGHL